MPKVFISYSWTNPEHEGWVRGLADALVNAGVDVAFDKYDLNPGDDAFKFMESMVSDPEIEKVVMVCNASYKEKADKRKGGVGVESQILTPELYKSGPVSKYIAILREIDSEGNPSTPIFYGGRIFIDMTDDALFGDKLEELIRTIYNKPIYKKPSIGQPPSYITGTGKHSKINLSQEVSSLIKLMPADDARAVSALVQYLDKLKAGLGGYAVAIDEQDFSPYAQSVLDFKENAVEFSKVCNAAALSKNSDITDAFHRFFEQCYGLTDVPSGAAIYVDHCRDNYSLIIYIMFMIRLGAFIKHDRLEQMSRFINTKFYVAHGEFYKQNPLRDAVIFNQYSWVGAKMSEAQRKTDAIPHILKDICQSSGVDFADIMNADLMMYLRSLGREMWFPRTLIFAANRSMSFKVFERAASQKYFDRIYDTIEKNKGIEFKELVALSESEKYKILWQSSMNSFLLRSNIDIKSLCTRV